MAVVLPAVRQPRLLDETTWREARRLRPNAAELHLKLNGISYGVLTMPWTDTVLPMRAWVEIYTSKGSAGLYRVTRADSRKFHTVAYTLQHAIDTLNDSLWREQGDFKGTAQAFLTKLLSFQRVPYWQLGTCEDTGNYKVTGINYGKLSDMLSGFVESRTGYYLSYDFSTTPWTVSWLRLPAGVRCEWRVRRNVKTCSVTTFDTDQCTRLYYTVSPAEGQEADPTVYTLDNTEQQQRGVYIEKAITIDADEIADPAAFAAQFMQDHAEPGVQIAVEGYEFARQTGDRLDAYELGDLARCIVDDLGPLRERIVALNYPDLIGAPESVSAELANNLPKFSESLTTASKTAAAAARSARANAKAVEKQEKEITHWSQIVTYHGEALDGSGVTAMYESGIDMDATGGVKIYSLEEGMQALYSAIRVNASSIDMESQRILMVAKQAGTGAEMFDPTHSYQIGDRVGYNGKMYEFTAAHSGTEENPLPWDPTHVQEVASLQDQIADNAGDIYDITQSAIMQNASSITGVVGKFEIDSQGNLVVKDGGAFKLKKNNVEYGLYSEDNLTAGLVVGLINNQQTGEGVTVARISADKIILDGTTTATTLDARLANVDDLFTNTGYAGTINVHSLNTVSKNGSAGTVTGDIITANTQLSIGTGTNGGSGNLYYRGEQYYKRALTLGPSNGYIAEGYFLGNSNTALSINHSHALAITELTGDDAGKIQVTLGAAVSESSSERIKNFKIADTAYYKSRVGISNLSVTGGTDQGSQQDYSDSSAQVVTVVADGYYIVAADAKDGTHEYKKFHVPAGSAVTVNVVGPTWDGSTATYSRKVTFSPSSGSGSSAEMTLTLSAYASNFNWHDTGTNAGKYTYDVTGNVNDGSGVKLTRTVSGLTLTPTDAINYGKTLVSPTSASISNITANSSTGLATATLTVKYTGNTTGVPITGVDVSSIYQAGKNSGTEADEYDVVFDITMSDGGSYSAVKRIPVDCVDVYNKGVEDSGSSVTYVYAYASGNDNPVNIRKTASGSTSNLLGRLYCNTKVQLISYANGYACVSYDGYTGYISCSGGIDHNYVWSTPKSGKTVVTSGWAQAPSGGGGDDPTPGKTITKVTISSVAHNSSSAGSLTVSVCSATSSNNMPTSKTAAYVNSTTWNLPIASGGYRTTSSSVSSYLKAVVNGHYAGHAGSSHSSMLTVRVVVSVDYSDGSSSTECVETTSFPY